MAHGGKLDAGVYRVGKPTKVSPILYEQKIVEIFENGDIATASDYGRKLGDFKSQKYPIIKKEQLEAQYKMADGGMIDKGGEMADNTKMTEGGTLKNFNPMDLVGKSINLYYDDKRIKDIGNIVKVVIISNDNIQITRKSVFSDTLEITESFTKNELYKMTKLKNIPRNQYKSRIY
jgi:hypothetical protein